MEHPETEEMHDALDQALRAALMAVGTVQQRLARRQQVAAERARVAAAGTRTELDTFTAAQDTMLRHSLRRATDPTWFDTTTAAERVATRDMADRYSAVSPYAQAVLDRIDTEAARRGETLTAPEPRNTALDPAAGPTSQDSTATQDGPQRRRTVAADTPATEAEVADRLAAIRSFPRTLWSQLRHASQITLRPGSPTTLPRTRDTGLER